MWKRTVTLLAFQHNRKCSVITSTIYLLLRFCRSCIILISRSSLSLEALLALPWIAWVLRNRRQAFHSRKKATRSPRTASERNVAITNFDLPTSRLRGHACACAPIISLLSSCTEADVACSTHTSHAAYSTFI